ncbi:MAG: NAD(P)/FAD-dependent oxidoreductase [Calditrichaeota bacterium]|nr:MAG: NAD(P)/FAD-dependent oxidoreductase [Calditrichota bacterium]
MQTDYDVVIVGAGPAGSTTALYATQAGLNVLLVDKKQFPRDKICGDAISGKSITYLKELGLLDCVERAPHRKVNSVLFSAPNGKSVKIYFKPSPENGNLHGYICRRLIFDNILFQAAQEKVDTVEGFTVTDVLRESGRVLGIVGRETGGASQEIRARIVVGADGFSSIISRKLGIYDMDPDHWIVATRAYYRGVSVDPEAIELNYIEDILPGYFWIFPADDGMVNVGLGMVHSRLKKKGIRLRYAHLEAVKAPHFRERFEQAEQIGDIAGWNLPVGSKRRVISGDGFVLVGDAAGLIDPFTGEGIGNAMCSARIAARVIAEALSDGDVSAARLATYDQRLWQRLGPELRLSYQLQKIGQIKPLINLVVSKAAANPDVADWIAGMMAGIIPKRELANPLTYVKLLFK